MENISIGKCIMLCFFSVYGVGVFYIKMVWMVVFKSFSCTWQSMLGWAKSDERNEQWTFFRGGRGLNLDPMHGSPLDSYP